MMEHLFTQKNMITNFPMLTFTDPAHIYTLKSFTHANEHNRNTPIQLEINIFTHEAHRYTQTCTSICLHVHL